MRKSLKKQILRGAQDDKDYVSNFGDRTLGQRSYAVPGNSAPLGFPSPKFGWSVTRR